MGLFDKKYCDICGEKIGLLGNRKLENGNLCKKCAKKLSPWFSDRRSSTVEEIKAQLAYREENRQKVAAFHTTRTLGTNTKVLLDEDAGKFMVTRARDLQEANPDVLDFADVTGCNLDIDESRSELKREDKDGKEVSYNPPRYEYSYDFYITICRTRGSGRNKGLADNVPALPLLWWAWRPPLLCRQDRHGYSLYADGRPVWHRVSCRLYQDSLRQVY